MTERPREILTVAETAAADRAAIAAGTPGVTLMQRAGEAVANSIAARFAPGPTLVLAGPGNNGGDGYVAAASLAKRGWQVRIEALAPPKSADALAAREAWRGEIQPLSQRLSGDELVIDALFGAGLDRPLPQEVSRLARQAQRMAERVIAVDTPSGLAGDTGRPLGDACFRAAPVRARARTCDRVSSVTPAAGPMITASTVEAAASSSASVSKPRSMTASRWAALDNKASGGE